MIKNNNMEMISVLITAYKAKEFILECINSVVDQTIFEDMDYEIIIGIDGCKETKDYLTVLNLQNYDRYDKVKIYYFPQNKGTYITSNTLVKLSKGDFILRFDSDDVMSPTMVEKMYNALLDKRVSLVIPSYLNFDEGGVYVNDKKLPPAHGITFMRKETMNILGGWKPWKCGADSDLLYRLSKFDKSFTVQSPLMLRRIHDKQLTIDSKTAYKSEERLNNVKKIEEKFYTDEIYIEPEYHKKKKKIK